MARTSSRFRVGDALLTAGSARAQHPVDAPTFDWRAPSPGGTAAPRRRGRKHPGDRDHRQPGPCARRARHVPLRGAPSSSRSSSPAASHDLRPRYPTASERVGRSRSHGKQIMARAPGRPHGGAAIRDQAPEAKTGEPGVSTQRMPGGDVVQERRCADHVIGAAGTVEAKSAMADIHAGRRERLRHGAHGRRNQYHVTAGTAPVKLSSGDGSIEVHVAAAGAGNRSPPTLGTAQITVSAGEFRWRGLKLDRRRHAGERLPLTVTGSHMDYHHSGGRLATPGRTRAPCRSPRATEMCN